MIVLNEVTDVMGSLNRSYHQAYPGARLKLSFGTLQFEMHRQLHKSHASRWISILYCKFKLY
jgi:hypothetical protein